MRYLILLLSQAWIWTASVAFGQPGPAEIHRLRIENGRYAGSYALMLNDLRSDWYFTNLGLIAVCDSYPRETAQYLSLYVRNVDPKRLTIDRLQDYRAGRKVRSDSDDSYAATFISLAVRHREVAVDREWWMKNRGMVKKLAKDVILASQKPSGLVSNFVGQDGVGYLQDNCEVYRALADLGQVLVEEKDPDATAVRDGAARVATGIAGLFNSSTNCFEVADIPGDRRFYPYRTGQVFPQVFQVPLGSEEETRRMYDLAYRFLNADGEDWPNGRVNDDSLGGFPHMELGYAAAIRGDDVRARAQLKFFTAGMKPQFSSIHEVGWAIRAIDVLTQKGSTPRSKR